MTRCILVGEALWCNPSQTSADPLTSSSVMVGYDETSWNKLQVCCIHLPFSLFFPFFSLHCASPKRRWGVGMGMESRGVFGSDSHLDWGGVRWRVATRKRAVPHAKLTGAGEKPGENWGFAPMNKTKSAGDWRLPSRIPKLHLLWRNLFLRALCGCTRARLPESLCMRAVRTHKSNTVSLQRALAAARDTQFQWRDEKWIKEQQKKGRQAE